MHPAFQEDHQEYVRNCNHHPAKHAHQDHQGNQGRVETKVHLDDQDNQAVQGIPVVRDHQDHQDHPDLMEIRVLTDRLVNQAALLLLCHPFLGIRDQLEQRDNQEELVTLDHRETQDNQGMLVLVVHPAHLDSKVVQEK